MSAQILNTTPLINKVLDIIADGMLLLRSDEISVDYSNLYGFELKLVLHITHFGELNIVLPNEDGNKIQEQIDELMLVLAEEIFEHNPAMNANLVSINLEISLAPEMLANFNNTTIH